MWSTEKMWRRALTGCTGATSRGGGEYDVDDDQCIQTSISDVSLWRKSSKTACHQSSDIIDYIVRKQRADYLGVVVEHGWDVNKRLQVYGSGRGRLMRTALHHAVFYRWHEGVRLLLNAGADCNIKCHWSWTDLPKANNHFLPPDRKHTPMCVAIENDDLDVVRLLLQNGLDLEDTGCDYASVNRHERSYDYFVRCTEIARQKNADVLNELLTNGQGVTSNLDEQLQYLLQYYLQNCQFLPKHLDLLFTHGVCIDPDYQETTPYHSFEILSSVNTIRWYIRHGARCTSYHFSNKCYLVCSYIGEVYSLQRYTLPVLGILLQIGSHHSNSLKEHLGELMLVMQENLHQEKSADQDGVLDCKMENMNFNILHANEQLADEKLDQRRRQPFPTDRRQQMAHLREFSDQSLDVYPEEVDKSVSKLEGWEQTLKIISDLLYFLNQPHTLLWHCRVYLRQNLVSLSPSVIRILPGPAALKRYILCHEL